VSIRQVELLQKSAPQFEQRLALHLLPVAFGTFTSEGKTRPFPEWRSPDLSLETAKRPRVKSLTILHTLLGFEH
jgi:hypothetical protein